MSETSVSKERLRVYGWTRTGERTNKASILKWNFKRTYIGLLAYCISCGGSVTILCAVMLFSVLVCFCQPVCVYVCVYACVSVPRAKPLGWLSPCWLSCHTLKRNGPGSISACLSLHLKHHKRPPTTHPCYLSYTHTTLTLWNIFCPTPATVQAGPMEVSRGPHTHTHTSRKTPSLSHDAFRRADTLCDKKHPRRTLSTRLALLHTKKNQQTHQRSFYAPLFCSFIFSGAVTVSVLHCLDYS